MSSSPGRRATFRDVFASGEFRALWASQILSVSGDRLALVALTLLIYDRTHSPLLAAVAYAAGYVPYVIGALFLSGLADRRPRREVMVACDVIRAALVAAMLVPHIPLDALIGLLYVTTAIQPPFDAARSAILADVVTGERYALAAATMQTTFRVAIVAGAAAGGVVVAVAGARFALGVDAATFIASAVVVRLGTAARPSPAQTAQTAQTARAARAAKTAKAANAAPQPREPRGPGSESASGRRPSAVAQLGAGVRVVFGDEALCTLVLLGWLAALYEIPEGLAAPYAGRLGGGPVAAGLLIASGQLGAAVAMPVFTRKIGPLTRLRWMGPMACCACLVLILTALRPGLAVSMAIFAMAGTFAIYQIAANTAFVARVPNERRAQAFGLANAGLIVGQGVAFTLAGAAAEVVPPSTVIAVSGGLGALAACGLALRWRRMSPAVGRHSARHFRGQALRVSDVRDIRDVGDVRGQAAFARQRQAPIDMARSRVRG